MTRPHVGAQASIFTNITVNKALTVTEDKPRLLRASASADWSARRLLINFYSVTADDTKLADHANYVAIIEEIEDWLKE